MSARAVPASEPPAGLRYEADFIAPSEERDLLRQIQAVEFAEVRFHGYPAKRTVAHFGVDYEYDSGRVEVAGPLPDWLLGVCARCEDLAGVDRGAFVEALVTRYPPGAAIGWHRDAPAFGGSVAGVSLGAECRMRFRRTAAGTTFAYDLPLPARSAYVMSGAARWTWQHSIPPVTKTRHSITFRTLRALSR
jgi:DNA oxidative demethylase